LAARDRVVVVDEAFAEVAPEISLAVTAGGPGLVVLRSFGKFFGLAGLRLGFALAEPGVARRLAQALGPWAVAGPALRLGRLALEDGAWAAAMRSRLAVAATALDKCLKRCGFPVLGGTSLFRLAGCPDAADVADTLGRLGILVRGFDASPDRLRFGLPPDEPALARLEQGLRVRGR
jgi:cobalamin biosynthetic protein CobC